MAPMVAERAQFARWCADASGALPLSAARCAGHSKLRPFSHDAIVAEGEHVFLATTTHRVPNFEAVEPSAARLFVSSCPSADNVRLLLQELVLADVFVIPISRDDATSLAHLLRQPHARHPNLFRLPDEAIRAWARARRDAASAHGRPEM